MKRNKVGIIIAIIAIVAFLLSYIISYANTGETIYVQLAKTYNGIGYGIGNPDNGVNNGNNINSAYIWNLITYDNNTTTNASIPQRNLYCIKGNYGDTWESNNTSTRVGYNLSYDLQNQRDELNGLLGEEIADNVVKALINPEQGCYKQLLWVLDNMYIEGEEVSQYLEKIYGATYSEEYKDFTFNDYEPLLENRNYLEVSELLTSADIKAVQQAVIWHFTNYKIDGTEFYDQTGKGSWLNIKEGDINYRALEDRNESRNIQAELLYKKLVNKAEENAGQYNADNNYQKDVAVNTTGLTKNENGKYRLTTNKIDSKYIVGPIRIDGESSSAKNISIEVKNQNNENISYTFTNATGESLGTEDIKTLVGREEGFYISVSENEIEKINIQIGITQETTKKTLWLNGKETEELITLEGEQPLVEVTREEETKTTEIEAIIEPEIEPELKFDLALRKYITQLNGRNLENTRIPKINTSTLENGTTAEYKHRKDPVVVQDKDEVTYTIAIYNEGQKAGYAKKIIDQLPVGLISSTSNSSTVVSKDKAGNARNTYEIVYNPVSNQIVFTIVNTEENPAVSLNEYKTGNLDYETIEIKCKVAQEADTKEQIVLTNVAWISMAYDAVAQEDIDAIGEDRDSEPQTSPNVKKDTISNYTGSTDNAGKLPDLADSEYFYKGEQDDDDFEKLVLMPIEKKFDLALFKHIAAISKNETIEAGEYITDTKNIDGRYLRAPVVTAINAETGKITYEENDKEALLVEPGDYVLYTIRVYNEGELNGYASKIKDTLPIGLEFVAGNEEYNGIWNIDGIDEDGRQVVSTTWFAKGQGAELNSVEGDSNYRANLLHALNKEGAISTVDVKNPDYLDAQVLCRVVESATSNRILVNYAQIAEDSDEDGNPIDDVDSTTDEWIDEDDDQDIERIKVRTAGQYDLILVKEDENGEQLNSTATFEVTINGVKEEKTVTGKLTIAQDMLVDADHLTDDVYIIRETKAPDAYCEFDGIITITVTKAMKEDGSGYEKNFTYVVTDLEGNDITETNKDVKVYLDENGNIKVEVINHEEPEIHKGVKNVENQDSGYNADEVHTWVVESNIPSNVTDYKLYNIVDEIDYRLKFEETENVSVKVGNVTLDKDTDYKIEYVQNPTGVQDKTTSGTLKLTFIDIENSIVASNKVKDNAGKTIQVTFKTTFAKDENGNLLAAMGEQIENQAKLEYQNISKDTKVVKESEKPEIHTGGVILYKYNLKNEEKLSLAGARFGIYKTREDAINNRNVIATAVSDENGIVRFIGIQYGGDAKDNENNKTPEGTYEYDADKASTKYWVAEIEAPEGYKKYSEVIEVIINKDSYNEEQIKYEVENRKLKFDLALRKFITAIGGTDLKDSDGKYIREPIVDVTGLKDGTSTTAIYTHPKTPVSLNNGNTVVYTIRVYNEGEIAGYANKVTDYLPPYLIYVEDSSINEKYGWNISENGRIATTDYLSNKEISEFNGTELDYEDIQIECKISDSAIPHENITNIAEISEYKYGDTIVPEDTDSKSNNIDEKMPKDEELPDYKKEQENDEYVPGNQDDDDFEKIYIKSFDLALRKFITEIQEKEITSRIPQVKINDGKISYEHTKEPITLHVGDVVIYTLRIYNEGEVDGYAKEITDDIPEYLEYLPDEATNVDYMWKMYDKDGKETTNVDEAVKVKTVYLSREKSEENLIKAFNGTTLEYKDIKIAFKVKDPNSNSYIITNHAQISDDSDEKGNSIKDIDSKTDEWNDGEDDQDIENVKVEYFDLALLKFVSKVIVIDNGKETITETGYNGHEDPEPVVKVELHRKKLTDVTVKFGYGITITNEGDIAGYATEITDYIPQGLRFEASDNPLWKDEGNNVISTKQLENTLLQPGESKTVEVILTWINGADNLALKTNTAEISQDKNEYDVPDKDSTPDNKKDGEDDIDIAKVILAVSTGAAKTYFTLATGLLAIVLAGVVFIKKFVI